MRDLGSVWDSLVANDADMDVQAVINGTTYTAITAPVIHRALMSSEELTVGNCVSASLTFSVKTNNVIPKSASVVIRCRMTQDMLETDWYEFGTFYVSKRTVDDGLVTLECYDAMLKGNQPYGGSTSPLNWPKRMYDVVYGTTETIGGTTYTLDGIATRMGLTIDSRTSIRTDSAYVCSFPGEKTLLEVLGWIGACNGGNWIITPENKLRLVPLAGSGASVNVPIVMNQITTASSYSITGVTMVIDENHVYSAGNDSGYVLTINPNPYSSQAIADNLLTTLRGLTYQPFSISGAVYNPASELGDRFVVGSEVTAVVYEETCTYSIGFEAEASAPGKDETEDEYPYPSQIQQLQKSTVELKRNTETLSTSIQQTQQDITLEVIRATNAEEAMESRLLVAEGDILLKVSEGDVESIIETKADSIRLKSSNIAWNADNSSMTASGILECSGARIVGTMASNNEVNDVVSGWVSIDNGAINGGYAANVTKGSIYFWDGITLETSALEFDVNSISVKAYNSDTGAYGPAQCFTGTIYSTEMVDDGNGNSHWTCTPYRVVNGLILA